MAETRIRTLTNRDLRFAQTVREIAGWNQTDADWERLLAWEPEGCFLIESDGHPAGTATTTRYGNEVGWIGMVLVHPDFRRRGLATRLLETCVEYLRPRVRCIRLDATPDGRAVYERLGFVDEGTLARWEGRAPPGRRDTTSPLRDEDWPWIGRLDRRFFGADRVGFLQRLAAPARTATVSPEAGWGMIRDGVHAHYLGPAIVAEGSDGESLIRSLLATAEGERTYWDIPDDCHRAVDLAGEFGFSRQRPLVRMRLGSPDGAMALSGQWAIGGPETG